MVPPGVKVEVASGQVVVQGPKGKIVQPIHPDMTVTLEGNVITVMPPVLDNAHQALHGLTHRLISNAITGVTQGYRKTLELMGIGYRVQQSGKGIVLNVGLSHSVEIQPMEGITLSVEGNNRIHVDGIDKQRVGEMAAMIRRVRPPNPYKEKGIRYIDEKIRLKPGKAAGRKA